tara:strand:+ start:304 stop:534 length:231 start_codon:yes stop_codon:yes gene_type:complete
MREDNKKYNTDDVVWYYPFPREKTPLRNTRYKAIVLDAIEHHYYDYSIYIIEEGHPNRRKKARAINLVVYDGNDVG